MQNLSVIIPWKDRPELKTTLMANAAVFNTWDAEVLVLNCGGDTQGLTALIEDVPIAGLRHVFIPHTTFNRSLAKNIGLHRSSGRVLFFLDADIILTTDVFADALPILDERNAFVQVRRVNESQPRIDPYLSFMREKSEIQEMVLLDGRRAIIHCLKSGDGSRCGPGLMFVRRAQVLAVNGFNSDLQGWGWEDLDFQMRLQLVTNASLEMAGEVTHLTHGDDVRGANECQINMMKCGERYRRANFEGTYTDDARRWQDKIVDLPLGRVAAH